MSVDLQTVATRLVNSNNQLQATLTNGSKAVITNVDVQSGKITYRLVKRGRPKLLETNDVNQFVLDN